MIGFSVAYSKLLDEEALYLKEYSTWNTGTLTANIGPNFKAKDINKPTERHRKIIKDPGFRKYAQTVPDMHKIDPKSLQALEDLKVANAGRKTLSSTELQKICQQFGIVRLNPTTPKSLGNTGILLKFDPNVRGYVIEK